MFCTTDDRRSPRIKQERSPGNLCLPNWNPSPFGLSEAPSQAASLAVAGVAVAALTASGRKALNIKPQLVTLSAFENELGVQAPVGFLALQASEYSIL